MQDERDDREQDEEEEQESAKSDPFDDLKDLDDDAAFRAWELQIHAIETIGELYVRLAVIETADVADVTRAVGNALIDLVEDHNPRKVAVMASTVATNSRIEPES